MAALPAGHCVHSLLDDDDEEPAWQAEQLAAPASENVPDAQAVHDAACALENVPPAQSSHSAALFVAENVPATQGAQVTVSDVLLQPIV